ncbi:hypothetical protein ACFQ71_42160, partial [Streptomyces sp. NPDC056534]|uniref:hypothetical protein n=1 Tax=Streptomyces sp. NPDC056534 TaxID=3345857 RepID=UPI0036B509E4
YDTGTLATVNPLPGPDSLKIIPRSHRQRDSTQAAADGGPSWIDGMPPCSRNHLNPQTQHWVLND